MRGLTDRGSAAAAPRASEYQSGGRRASTTEPAAAGRVPRHSNQSGAADSCNRLLGGELSQVENEGPESVPEGNDKRKQRRNACDDAKGTPTSVEHGE